MLLPVLVDAVGGYVAFVTQAGVNVPLTVDLAIMTYVDQRDEKKLRFDPALEFKDPYGLQEMTFPSLPKRFAGPELLSWVDTRPMGLSTVLPRPFLSACFR